MIIGIGETSKCWVCGDLDNKKTQHHAIPKHLNPINNITVPVCEDCHKRINASDINGMYSYLYKIKKMIGENVGGVNRLLDLLNEHNKGPFSNGEKKQ